MKRSGRQTVRNVQSRFALVLALAACALLAITPAGAQTNLDYGDADAGGFPVLLAQDGARHVVTPDVYLGSRIDADLDGQSSLDALGDDTDAQGDDEDGVVFFSLLVPGQVARLRVTASTNGYLQGWFDFARTGWSSSAAQVLSNQVLVAGLQEVEFPVPAGTWAGPIFARFRFSTQLDVGMTGAAPDGEVEDYRVDIAAVDLGDAPETPPTRSYPTTLANDGGSHVIVEDLYLGEQIDGEADGQPTDGADGDGADEDGVVWLTPLTAGRDAAMAVVASTAGYLHAWIDYDGDGTWQQAADHVWSGALLKAGTNELFFVVPTAVHAGATYARFRFSSQDTLSPHGPAPDGEVEDYQVLVERLDFGDAFGGGSYPTGLDQDGARHALRDGVYLGVSIDSEPDAAVGAGAMGDDELGIDDEDGVTQPLPLEPGDVRPLTVVASTNGFLQGWIDFNQSGDWEEPYERVFQDQALVPGTNTLEVLTPDNAMAGGAMARFRFATAAGVGVDGPAPDGEVEDHLLSVELGSFDYGDAPAGMSYPTRRMEGGPRHRLSGVVHLGPGIDEEFDGQPSPAADGDDDDVDGDDEDGVSFAGPWMPGTEAILVVAPSGAGYLQAWMDFNADGDWMDAGEQVCSNRVLEAGFTNWMVSIPPDVSAPEIAARFRFSTEPNLGIGGAAPDGEVEDYMIPLARVDCGDAPDTGGFQYPVRIESGGAYHLMLPGIRLGARIDADVNGQPSLQADGDDTDGHGDDEDGVAWLTTMRPGALAALRVSVSAGGYLQGWMDFNRDGDWADAGERVFQDQALATGTHLLMLTVPADASVGATFARFRFSGRSDIGVGGYASNGEVEDYATRVASAVAPPVAGEPCDIWLQRPNGEYGIDVQSWMQPSLGAVNGRVVRAVDDWPADGRRVTGCRWWGSYINWTNNPAAVPASSRATGFRLTLYADGLSTNLPVVPVPGLELTNATVSLLAFNSTNAVPGQATERLYGTSVQSAFSTPGDFEYEYEYRALFPGSWPVVAGRRYWLGVEAIVSTTPTYRWGWCVAYPREGHDRAACLRKSNETGWSSMTYPPNVFPWATATNHPDRGRPVELAFELLSDDCPRRAHQWPQWLDTVVPDGAPAWYRMGDVPGGASLRADDFIADGRRIASVVWQGCYAEWNSGMAGGATNPVAAPVGNGHPVGFLLGWYATNATGCTPGVLVTNLFVPMALCGEQYDSTWEQPWEGSAGRQHVYAYRVNLLDPNVSGEAWPGVANCSYWLSIQAVFGSGFSPGSAGHAGWLWQNAVEVQGCSSVSSFDSGDTWSAASILDPNPLAGSPLDLAFDLMTDAAGLSPLYDPPEILTFNANTNGGLDLATIGDLGSGVQVLQFTSNLTTHMWMDLATNRLPRELPYTNQWPDARPPAGARGFLRVLQR
ncbi:MAG: hypothetical protein K8T26_18540 [Lentisphaerae bacterium]|nr:hypothetical protein [Lentisphaerota bacterium]